jgi:cyanate permease
MSAHVIGYILSAVSGLISGISTQTGREWCIRLMILCTAFAAGAFLSAPPQ